MKKIGYILLAVFLMASCSKDASKLSWSTDYVLTGEVVDITANSAVLSGYINFFGEINEIFKDTEFETWAVVHKVHKADLQGLLDTLGVEMKVVIPKDCPDTVVVQAFPCDVDYMEAGVSYDLFHDFRNAKFKTVTNMKLKSIITPITDLTPQTTYFYKTYLKFRVDYELTCEQLPDFKTGKLDLGDAYDYYVYGDTKSFKTL